MELKKKLKRVILIDDDEPTNFLHERLVGKAACAEELLVFPNSEKALDYLNATAKDPKQENTLEKTDLIFLDINMPRIDGWDFINYYRQIPPLKRNRYALVMLTASVNPDDETRAGTIPEISGFYTKPMTKEMLASVIQRFFNHCF